MILLFGGTSETAPIAEKIAGAGFDVLASTATDVELSVGDHPRIRRRRGRLNMDQMIELIEAEGIRCVVDATHPFARDASITIAKAAKSAGIGLLTYTRDSEVYEYENMAAVDTHEQAAALAFYYGKPALLTIGSNNAGPYAAEARRTGLTVVARVLDHPASIEACRKAGLNDDEIIAMRGPFSVEQNIDHINQIGAGVLVTKDSGKPGGVPEKVEAARRTGIHVVLVNRPPEDNVKSFKNIDDIVVALADELSHVD